MTVSMSKLRNLYHRITVVTAENSTLTMTLTGDWRRRWSELRLKEPNVNVSVYLCWGLVFVWLYPGVTVCPLCNVTDGHRSGSAPPR